MDFFAKNYALSSFIFLRGLGAIYFVVFLSLYQQVDGLFSSIGISPIADLANFVKKTFGKKGFLKAPSIFLLKSNDHFLKLCTVTGIFLSMLLMAGIFPPLMIFILWAIYLSFVSLGQEFLSYQWDILLLEVSVLAFFLSFSKTPPVMGVICFQFFLFRFMFSSGYCKIRADKNWRNLSSMGFHFETQPLPNPLSWYFHQFSGRFPKMITFLVLFLELAVPFLFLGPENLKVWGFFLSVFLQVLIILSGNFCFFNFLTILLHLFLINDSFYSFISPASINGSNTFLEIIFGILLSLNILRFLGLFFKKFESLRIFPAFCLSNSYGLFARMTTKRYEINLEGSLDGNTWQRIPFKYKVEDIYERGRQIAPLQPRLDWQMWFLALDPSHLSPWFNDFLAKVFKGSEGVIALIGEYPFKNQAPKFIRVSVALYRFSNLKEKKESGKFWIKEDLSSFIVEN